MNTKDLILYTKDLSVLFAEDHDELRESVAEILQSLFNNVTTAKDGQEALELYTQSFKNEKSTFDIVLSDIRMPFLDGVELTREIYKLNPSQLLIIVSAHDDSKYLLPLINLGIEYFISKPINYEEFTNVLLNSAKKISLQSKNTPINKIQIKLSDSFIYDRTTSALLENAQNIYLTKFEILFLQLLTTQVGKIFPNEEVIQHFVSFNETIDAQNIRKLVSKLRKKIPKNSLESIYGVGYKIIAMNEK